MNNVIKSGRVEVKAGHVGQGIVYVTITVGMYTNGVIGYTLGGKFVTLSNEYVSNVKWN